MPLLGPTETFDEAVTARSLRAARLLKLPVVVSKPAGVKPGDVGTLIVPKNVEVVVTVEMDATAMDTAIVEVSCGWISKSQGKDE